MTVMGSGMIEAQSFNMMVLSDTHLLAPQLKRKANRIQPLLLEEGESSGVVYV